MLFIITRSVISQRSFTLLLLSFSLDELCPVMKSVIELQLIRCDCGSSVP